MLAVRVAADAGALWDDTQHHMLFVQIGAIGELEGTALQAIDLEAEGAGEPPRGGVAGDHAEIDLLEPWHRAGVGQPGLEHRPAEPLASRRRHHEHAPEEPAMALLAARLAP